MHKNWTLAWSARSGAACLMMGLGVAALGWPGHADAQGVPAQTQQRLERMEREMVLMQRQLYQQHNTAAPSAIAPSANAADLEVRLTQMEEQMRRLTGQVEQVQYGIEQLNKSLDKREKDMTFRLEALERGGGMAASVAGAAPAASAASSAAVQPVPAAPTAAATMSTSTVPAANAVPMQPPVAASASALPQRSTAENTRNLATPAPGATAEYPYGVDSREHYNQAFQLLNQARFEEARTALQSFIDRFPEDALLGNAYYWLGETFYVERDYLNAADIFRQGFEKAPKGPKAPDNLLKLGMSLAAMGKSTDACVVYSQLATRYNDAGASVNQRIKQERSRLDCPA